MNLRQRVLFATIASACFIASVSAQERGQAERYGTANFPVSCDSEVQQLFNRAVAILHSFEFPSAEKAFTAILDKDPGCAMAYWGIALGSRGNPISRVPNAAGLKKGLAAIEKAKAIGARTERERDYIAAMEAFYKDAEKLDHATRSVAYEEAMGFVYLKYRGDREAAVFYALSLLPNEQTVSTDNTYGKQVKAGEILEKVFAEQPDHPGVAHYIIHAYDHPLLASRALTAARKYDQIAPASAHATHMPSHIYTRLGLWQDSIQSNLAAADVAKALARNNNPGATPPVPLHMLQFLMEAYLQVAEDQKAQGVLDELNARYKGVPTGLGFAIMRAGIPARYAIERRHWSDAASLQPLSSPFPYAEAITYFARAVGSARIKDIVGARKDIDMIDSLRDAALLAKDTYWAQETEILRLSAAGWLAHAEGKNEEALKLMRAGADLEDSTQQHHTARDPIVPAREQLGDLLIELGQPEQALREFETALQKHPNRFNGLYGAGRAAEASGAREKARAFYAKLTELCKKTDTERPELQRAKVFLARR
jgi:tetratricopeptide (TPR) repeat protein